MLSPSTSGAHRNLSVYGVPTRVNSPMVPRLTPFSLTHTSSVDPDSASGSPDEKPSIITISTRGCRYTAHASRQEARGVGVIDGLIGILGRLSGGLVISQC